MYKELHGYYLEDLQPGQTASFAKTFTEADITLFAGVSGDTNPVHLNAEFARESRFGERLVHGCLTASLVSTVLGTKLPGPGAIFVSQESRFRAPVKIGDTVVATVRVTEVNGEKQRVYLEAQCHVGATLVLEGKSVVYVERRPTA